MKLVKMIILSLILAGCISQPLKKACEINRHALYDLGSGSTKLTLIETDSCQERPIILLKTSEKVDYKDDLLKTKNSEFSESIQKKGTEALQKLKYEAEKLKAEFHNGIATAAFREARNSALVLEGFKKELGISIEVISQEKEAQLAYQAVRLYNSDPAILVWDMGGGSFQFTFYNSQKKEWDIYKGTLASMVFKDLVVHQVKKNSGQKAKLNSTANQSPNPMTMGEIKAARRLVQKTLKSDLEKSFLSRKLFKKVVGVEAVLNTSLKRHLKKSVYNVHDIDQWIANNHKKTDAELEDIYSSTLVTNMILISEIMKLLRIDEIHTHEASLVEGLLLSLD